MKSNNFFVSTALKPLSHSVIAALLHDIAGETHPGIDAAAVETVFFDSLDISSEGILSSPRTKQRILKTFQQEETEAQIRSFRENGNPLPDDYFESRFELIISSSNARKIVPAFLTLFREKLAENPALSAAVLECYRSSVQKGEWEPEQDISGKVQELFESESAAAVTQPAESTAAPDPPTLQPPPAAQEEIPDTVLRKPPPAPQEDTPDTVLRKQPGSAQMIYWQPQRHALPVRGLRNLEPLLAEHPLLFVTGFAGVGKSVLISAYIYQQVFHRALSVGKVYYYRFSESMSSYEQFLKSLAGFCGRNINGSPLGFEEEIAELVARADYVFVLDDLHALRDHRLEEFVKLCWVQIAANAEFGGKFVMLYRQLPEFAPQQNATFYHYQGLAVSESNALLRDLWNLQMPKILARRIAAKLGGNPERLLLFRNWFRNELHTDTELERFAAQLPESDGSPESELALSGYVATHLFESFERTDSRLNSFCMATSIFNTAEDEYFLSSVYDKIGGGDFQEKLESMVEDHQLLNYDSQAMCYQLPDTLKLFYDQQIADVHIRRALHNQAAILYEERFRKKQNGKDAIAGVVHFFKAEREEEALMLMGQIPDVEMLTRQQSTYLLSILNKINPETIVSAGQSTHIQILNGVFNYRIGQWGRAESAFAEAMAMDLTTAQTAQCQFFLGKIYHTKGLTIQSAKAFQDAIEHFKENGNLKGLAEAYHMLGDVHSLDRQFKNALSNFENAATCYKELDDLRNEQIVIDKMGQITLNKHHLDFAEPLLRRSLEISRVLEEPQSIARSLTQIAKFHQMRESWQFALDAYIEALEIYQSLNDRKAIAEVYRHLGEVYLKTDDLSIASTYLKNAQQIHEEMDNHHKLGIVYERLGEIHYCRREWEMAMEFYRQAQQAYREAGEEDRNGEMFAQIGQVYLQMGEHERALELFEKALVIGERLGEPANVARVSEEIGDIYQMREDTDYALDMYERARQLKASIDDTEGLAELNYKIGNIYKSRNDLGKAQQLFEAAKTHFSTLEHAAGLAKTCQALGHIHHDNKNWQEAREIYIEALKNYESRGDLQGMAEVNYSLGNLYYDLSDWERALNRYNTAVPLFEETADIASMAQVLGNISSIEFEQQAFELAVQKQVEILLYFQHTQNNRMVEKVLANLVSCHEELGQETFQGLLANCLEKLKITGVIWGQHQVVAPAPANEIIEKIFYAS